jgi:hypothetical protein
VYISLRVHNTVYNENIATTQRGLKYTEHKPFGRHYIGVLR